MGLPQVQEAFLAKAQQHHPLSPAIQDNGSASGGLAQGGSLISGCVQMSTRFLGPEIWKETILLQIGFLQKKPPKKGVHLDMGRW